MGETAHQGNVSSIDTVKDNIYGLSKLKVTAFAKIHWPDSKNTRKTVQDRLGEFPP